MYEIGKFIVYGNEGVCEIEDIGKINISGISNNRNYYTLRPINESGKIFTPTDTSVSMRPVSTYEEAQKLIELIPSMEELDCSNKNTKLLQSAYTNFIRARNCSDLLALILGIYKKKVSEASKGKKIGQVDEKFMKLAQSLINDEFSVALGIPKEEVETHIKEKIKQIEYKQFSN